MVAEGLPTQLACRVLDVSEFGFYAWRARPPSERSPTWLTDLIRQIHGDFRGVYGYRRVDAELTLGHGLAVGEEAVWLLMRKAGLQGLSGRPASRRIPNQPTAGDLVDRNEPDRLWVSERHEALPNRAVVKGHGHRPVAACVRLVKIARDSAVGAHSQAMITLKATLVTAPDELRGRLEPLTDFKLIGACAALDTTGDIADPAVAMRLALASLARRWLQLQEIKAHSRRLNKLTQTAAPDLIAAFGIGPDVAAEMLVTAGDNADRIRSDAALAKLCGACPIPAGSGKTNGRHRLNRGGNRQANAALHSESPWVCWRLLRRGRGPLSADCSLGK
jgi:Transposase IS116/IS110/IS902 family/HTH-like domain